MATAKNATCLARTSETTQMNVGRAQPTEASRPKGVIRRCIMSQRPSCKSPNQ
jgi:hypothetical protein